MLLFKNNITLLAAGVLFCNISTSHARNCDLDKIKAIPLESFKLSQETDEAYKYAKTQEDYNETAYNAFLCKKAEEGDISALFIAAFIPATVDGPEVSYFDIGARAGHHNSAHNLGFYYMRKNKFQMAIPLLEVSAEEGVILAYHKLYDIYIAQEEIVKANGFLEKAGESGDPGYFQELGKSVLKQNNPVAYDDFVRFFKQQDKTPVGPVSSSSSSSSENTAEILQPFSEDSLIEAYKNFKIGLLHIYQGRETGWAATHPMATEVFAMKVVEALKSYLKEKTDEADMQVKIWEDENPGKPLTRIELSGTNIYEFSPKIREVYNQVQALNGTLSMGSPNPS